MRRLPAWLQGVSVPRIVETVVGTAIAQLLFGGGLLVALWTVLPAWFDSFLRNLSPALVIEVATVQLSFSRPPAGPEPPWGRVIEVATVQLSFNLANILMSLVVLGLLTVVVRRTTAQPHTPRVRKVVYFDPDYLASFVDNPKAVRDFFVGRGFRALNAPQLGAWMNERIERGDAPFSLVVFAQDIAPDTVAQVRDNTCMVRRFLNAGGRVAWQGDVPFFYQGSRGLLKNIWDVDGCIQILEVWPNQNLNWFGPPATQRIQLTADGKKWGLSGVDRSDRPVEPARVTTVFSEDGQHVYAFSWHKNFNPKYPHSGFVRFWPGERHAPAAAVDEDFFRLATAFSPFVG